MEMKIHPPQVIEINRREVKDSSVDPSDQSSIRADGDKLVNKDVILFSERAKEMAKFEKEEGPQNLLPYEKHRENRSVRTYVEADSHRLFSEVLDEDAQVIATISKPVKALNA